MFDTAAPVPALLATYPPYPFVVARGSGDRLWDEQGVEYLDLYGGHCVCSTGHAQLIGYRLDAAHIHGLVGTVAGDDTVLLAVHGDLARIEEQVRRALAD